MKKDDFLVTTTVNEKSWALLWDDEEPLALDHPAYWQVCRDDGQVLLQHLKSGQKVLVTEECLAGDADVPLPFIPGEERHIRVNFKKLVPIRPAFLTSEEAVRSVGPAEQYVSAGIREHLISFREFPKKAYTADVVGTPVFDLTHNQKGVHVITKSAGLRFKPLGAESKAVVPGTPLVLTEKEVLRGAFIYGSYWWRVNKVATPDMLNLDELDKEIATQDLVSLQSLSKGFGTFLVVMLIALRGMYYISNKAEEERPKPLVVTEVELKKPKMLEKPLVVPTPKPAVVVQATPKPTPLPKKPDPPKVAKKPEPKPVQKPALKLAKLPPLPPKPTIKVPPKKQALPPPSAVAKAPPPRALPPPVAKAPDPSVVRNQEKASVAKSLNFLSTGPSKSVAALAVNPNAKQSARYANTGSGGLPASQSALNQMAKANTGDGPISTRGARGIASQSGIAGGHGKGLNEVQGKVAMNSLYGGGSGEALGSAIGGGGVSVTGPGKISDADIEKTLSKYLQKFQRCYEKALLSAPSLSGEVQIRWTIAVGGQVSGAQVVKSEMNVKSLHDCLTGELAKINFPSPKGGPATVKKPFRFKSASF